MTNACLTAAGALRPTGKPNQSDWDSNRKIRTPTASGLKVIRSLRTLEPGMLAQMSGRPRLDLAEGEMSVFMPEC